MEIKLSGRLCSNNFWIEVDLTVCLENQLLKSLLFIGIEHRSLAWVSNKLLAQPQIND